MLRKRLMDFIFGVEDSDSEIHFSNIDDEVNITNVDFMTMAEMVRPYVHGINHNEHTIVIYTVDRIFTLKYAGNFDFIDTICVEDLPSLLKERTNIAGIKDLLDLFIG